MPRFTLSVNRKSHIASSMSNICRCGTYPRIRSAIRRATEEV